MKSDQRAAEAGKGAKGKPPTNGIEARIQIVADIDAPIVYGNYVEVTHSPHDFLLSIARVPAKLPRLDPGRDGIIEVPVEAQAQVVLPPTVIPGLIRALLSQQRSYEHMYGIKLDMEGSNE